MRSACSHAFLSITPTARASAGLIPAGIFKASTLSCSINSKSGGRCRVIGAVPSVSGGVAAWLLSAAGSGCLWSGSAAFFGSGSAAAFGFSRVCRRDAVTGLRPNVCPHVGHHRSRPRQRLLTDWWPSAAVSGRPARPRAGSRSPGWARGGRAAVSGVEALGNFVLVQLHLGLCFRGHGLHPGPVGHVPRRAGRQDEWKQQERKPGCHGFPEKTPVVSGESRHGILKRHSREQPLNVAREPNRYGVPGPRRSAWS